MNQQLLAAGRPFLLAVMIVSSVSLSARILRDNVVEGNAQASPAEFACVQPEGWFDELTANIL